SSSATKLERSVQTMVGTYEAAVPAFRGYREQAGIAKPREADVNDFLSAYPEFAARDRISWNRNAKNDIAAGRSYEFDPSAMTLSTYRPFFKQNVYFHRDMNAMRYQLGSM